MPQQLENQKHTQKRFCCCFVDFRDYFWDLVFFEVHTTKKYYEPHFF
jgi:hypothetical protein